MTDTNKTDGATAGALPDDDLDGAWSRNDAADTQYGAPDEGEHYSSVASDAEAGAGALDDPNVIDVAPTASKKGSKLAGYLIIGAGALIGLGVLGGIGYKVMGLMGARSAQNKDTQVLTTDAQVSPAIPGGGDSLPGQPGRLDVGVPGAQEESSAAQIPQPPGQVPGAETVSASPSVPTSATSGSPAGMAAVGADAVPPKVAASMRAQVAPKAAATVPTSVATPVAPPVAPSAAPPVAALAPAVTCEPEAKPKTKTPARAGAAARHKPSVSVHQQFENKSSRNSAKPAASGKPGAVEKAKDVSEDEVVEAVPLRSGNLSGYKIMSIWPKTGEHQQATIKDANGKNYIVHQGDVFNGLRVQTINALNYEVRTDAGVIR